jgi:hypothetical protein
LTVGVEDGGYLTIFSGNGISKEAPNAAILF